ncbi:MAG TPA: hypothetical protein VJT49_18915 [Amycolatopsis sp.]|uniref:hypothetical protein n=1 Tax=Amycolatopsis sp. TaxID=37632 RepID=UPI002B49ED1C|nr:hypothetical protein [Amycolatopsis sp.]HKS47138.1 hypothetical protein [Amycolatopsis sp.]
MKKIELAVNQAMVETMEPLTVPTGRQPVACLYVSLTVWAAAAYGLFGRSDEKSDNVSSLSLNDLDQLSVDDLVAAR